MATDILRFAILGLGAGAVYGVTALGVVLVYRGSGVLNFAHGAVGMVGAFIFYNTARVAPRRGSVGRPHSDSVRRSAPRCICS